MKVIDFKQYQEKKEENLISPETIAQMDNKKLVETMKDLAEMLSDTKDENEKDCFVSLLYDAFYQVEKRLKIK